MGVITIRANYHQPLYQTRTIPRHYCIGIVARLGQQHSILLLTLYPPTSNGQVHLYTLQYIAYIVHVNNNTAYRCSLVISTLVFLGQCSEYTSQHIPHCHISRLTNVFGIGLLAQQLKWTINISQLMESNSLERTTNQSQVT